MRNQTETRLKRCGLLMALFIYTTMAMPLVGQNCEQRTATQFGDVVIFAINSVNLGEHAEVLSGDVVVQNAPFAQTLAPGSNLEVGNHTFTSANTDLLADRIHVQNQALVAGDVCYFSQLTGNGTIDGTIGTLSALPVFQVQPDFFAATGSGVDGAVDIQKGKVVELAPGDYGRLNIKKDGVAILTGGNYEFAAINLANGAQLLAAAAVEIRVRQDVETGNAAFVGPVEDSGVTAKDIVIFVTGEGGYGSPTGNVSVRIGTKGSIYANVFAERGTIFLINQVFATGAFIAKDIRVGPHSQIILDSAFNNDAPIPQSDAGTVDNAGTLTQVAGATADTLTDSVLDNDSDPNGDQLFVTSQTAVVTEHGVLNFIAPDGTFSYTHDGSETFTDQFTYEVCDDGNPSACAEAVVLITVRPPDAIVTVTTSGSGSGLVTSDPAGINCEPFCEEAFPVGTEIALTATADEGSVFVGWSGDDDCGDGLITADADITCNAIFEEEAIAKQVTVRTEGPGLGRVISDPRGIDCPGDCQFGFADYSRIELAAIPAEGSIFTGWSGDRDCGDGIISGPDNVDCVATFDLLPSYPDITVQVSISGSGRVSSTPFGIVCPFRCERVFSNVQRVFLTPIPDSGSEFVGWIGDSSCGEGIPAGANVSCTAVFETIDVPDDPVFLNVTVLGAGAVSSFPAGINCVDRCQASYDLGTEVRLFARPDPGFFFAGWGGDADCADGVVTLNGNTSCEAIFSPE